MQALLDDMDRNNDGSIDFKVCEQLGGGRALQAKCLGMHVSWLLASVAVQTMRPWSGSFNAIAVCGCVVCVVGGFSLRCIFSGVSIQHPQARHGLCAEARDCVHATQAAW